MGSIMVGIGVSGWGSKKSLSEITFCGYEDLKYARKCMHTQWT